MNRKHYPACFTCILLTISMLMLNACSSNDLTKAEELENLTSQTNTSSDETIQTTDQHSESVKQSDKSDKSDKSDESDAPVDEPAPIIENISYEDFITGDVYSSDNYTYVTTQFCTLLVDPDIEVPADFLDTVNMQITVIERETGLAFSTSENRNDKTEFLTGTVWENIQIPDSTLVIHLTGEHDQAMAKSYSNGIRIYTPYYKIDDYGISVLTHEMIHIITFDNAAVDSLTLLEGIAEVYGDRICLNTEGFPIAYDSYEYGTGIMMDSITPFNAEDFFYMRPGESSNNRAVYQYGTMLVTYLYETYGNNFLSDYAALSEGIMSEDRTSCDVIKEMCGDSVFEQFGIWYAENFERFRLRDYQDGEIVLSEIWNIE